MRCILLCLIASFHVSAAKVLLIESYHSEFPWDESYVEGIQSLLRDDIELQSIQMDTKRIPRQQYAEKAAQAYQRYQTYQPDVVILGDDNAFAYMLPKLFDEPISIVFLGINSNPRALLSQYRGQAKVTGVLERPLFTRSIAEISKLFDGDDFKVKVLFDSGITSQIAKQYMVKQNTLIRTNLGVEVDIQTIDTQEKWQHEVLSAKDEGFKAIIVGLYQTLVDKQGRSVPADSIIEWTNAYSELPIFAFWDFAVGRSKAIGGVVLFGLSQGQQAARLINQIVEHGHEQPIPIVIDHTGKAIYSEVESARWNIDMPQHWSVIE